MKNLIIVRVWGVFVKTAYTLKPAEGAMPPTSRPSTIALRNRSTYVVPGHQPSRRYQRHASGPRQSRVPSPHHSVWAKNSENLSFTGVTLDQSDSGARDGVSPKCNQEQWGFVPSLCHRLHCCGWKFDPLFVIYMPVAFFCVSILSVYIICVCITRNNKRLSNQPTSFPEPNAFCIPNSWLCCTFRSKRTDRKVWWCGKQKFV